MMIASLPKWLSPYAASLLSLRLLTTRPIYRSLLTAYLLHPAAQVGAATAVYLKVD